MKSTRDSVASWLWQARFALLALAIVLTALASTQLPSLGVSNSLEIWYPEDDPALLRYREFQERFGNDEIIVVAVTGDASFDSTDGRDRVAEITDQLYYVDGVHTVSSISSVPEAMAIARDRLISDDGRTAAFIVQLGDVRETEARRHQILDELRGAADPGGHDVRLAGYGVIYDTLNQSSTEGAAVLLIAAHLLMLLLLFIVLRRAGVVALTIGVVSVATIWTMGVYALFDQKLNMVTMALPTLVLVIAIADCVHVLRAVARQPTEWSRQERVTRGISEVLVPCLLTSLTTAFGFLALTLSALPIVATLGQFGAIGMLAALIAAFLILPAGLSIPWVDPPVADGRLDRLTLLTHDIGRRRPWTVIAAFALMVVAALVGIRQIETDTYSIGYLSDQHRTRLESDFVETNLGPYAPLDFVIEAEDVLDPDILDGVQSLQRAALALDDVTWSWSLLDALEIAVDTPASSLPAGEIDARLARLRYFSPDIAATMISEQGTLRLSFGAPMMSARQVQVLIGQIEDVAPFGDGIELRADGYAALYTRIVDRIVRAQIAGFATALLIIGATIAIATRSVSRCLLAVPANLIPVIATLGLMGWIGVPLDVATATIATVILGLIVDDTVHILRPSTGTSADLRTSIRNNVRTAGGALSMTTIVLCGGFLVLGLAELRSVAWFGGLSAFAMLVALVTDLMLLPALAELGTVRARRRSPTGLDRQAVTH